MGYRVASLLDDEAMPVTLVLSIELFLYLTRDVRKVTWVVILEGL